MAFPDLRYASLEAPDVRAYATSDPRGFLAEHRSGAILDEVQRAPELLSYLQAEVDGDPAPGRFVLTGSANFALMHSVSQSLAGRTGLLTLLPLGYDELLQFPGAPTDVWTAIWAGAYPAIFDRAVPPTEWLAAYTSTYVERDLRQLLNVGDLASFQLFLRLLAARSAQLLNLSSLGADAGVTHNTARAWLSAAETSYLAFRLQPLHVNVSKRLVKTPKVHFYDSGLLCYLLGIRDPGQLRHHPLRGAIFETWVVSEIAKARYHRGLHPALSFYRAHRGDEVDLVLDRGEDVLAIEAKSAETIAGDFLDGLKRFEETVTGALEGRPVRRVLVYGGDRGEERTSARVIPWRAAHSLY